MISRDFIEKVKIGLIAASIAAALISYILAVLRKKSAKSPAAREWLETTPVISLGKYKFNMYQSSLAAFFFLAAMGTLNYVSFSHIAGGNALDEYDLMHYYVVPKYFDELGYYNLLPALIIADDETGHRHCGRSTRKYLHQDPVDYARRPISYALSMKDEIKSRFTEDRWQQFVHDTMFLQRYVRPMPCKLWRQLLLDHGFNGTPVWMLFARPLAQLIPVESIRIITMFDVLWVLSALLAVGWAFGPRVGAFAWLFLTVSYSLRWPTVGWAMLRYDWISSIIIGLCMLKKKKYIESGGFFAFATTLRYFPGIWLFGIAAKGVHALVTNKDIPVNRIWQRVPRKYWQMALGFFAVTGVLVTASIAVDGTATFKQSFENMQAHVQPHNLSSRRMGMAIAAVYRGELDEKWISDEKREAVGQLEPKLRFFSLGLMILLGLGMTRLKDWEAVGLGLIPFFWLTTSSYYYYVILVSGVIIHAKGIDKPWHLFGIIMLFVVQFSLNLLEYIMPGMRYPNISIACVLLTIYSIGILMILFHDWWKTRKEPNVLSD
ncbi:MAG: hypothetical protein JXR76_09565 [Deltaproteobacteria bacterium]|nr:hypothetical protein [Deltaproteobacteria bacterium]